MGDERGRRERVPHRPEDGSVETIDVGAAGRGIAAGAGSIWISDSAQNRVIRLDPKSKGVTREIGVGSGPGALAFGAGALWVANTLDGTVSRIDPTTNAITSTATVVQARTRSPRAVARSGWPTRRTGRSSASIRGPAASFRPCAPAHARPG